MLCGRDVTGVTPDALARAGVCLIPEGRGIFPNLTRDREPAHGDVHGHALPRRCRTGRSRGSRACRSAASRRPARCRAASSRCSRWRRALATDPAVLLIDELSMGLAPLIVEELYDHVRRIAASGMSILIVEQFAHEMLGVADLAGIMLHGQHRRDGHARPDRRRARQRVPRRHAPLTGIDT